MTHRTAATAAAARMDAAAVDMPYAADALHQSAIWCRAADTADTAAALISDAHRTTGQSGYAYADAILAAAVADDAARAAAETARQAAAARYAAALAIADEELADDDDDDDAAYAAAARGRLRAMASWDDAARAAADDAARAADDAAAVTADAAARVAALEDAAARGHMHNMTGRADGAPVPCDTLTHCPSVCECAVDECDAAARVYVDSDGYRLTRGVTETREDARTGEAMAFTTLHYAAAAIEETGIESVTAPTHQMHLYFTPAN